MGANVPKIIEFLPKKCLIPHSAINICRAYRCYLGYHSYYKGKLNSLLNVDLIVKTFLRCMNLNSMAQKICDFWNTEVEPIYKGAKEYDFEDMTAKFEIIMKNLIVVFDNLDFEFNPRDQTLEYYSKEVNGVHTIRMRILDREL